MSGQQATSAVRVKGNSTVFGIIRNIKIVNAATNFGILLGTSEHPPVYNKDRANNIVVTRNEVHTSVYGIEASYNTENNTISYNAVFLNATTDWQYGITCQGGTFYCNVIGNFIDARNAQTGVYTSRTVGIQLGDQRSKDGYPNDTLHWRNGAFDVAKYNTVTNATGHGIISDTMNKGQIFGNLVYQNYPGRKDISGWKSRGIMIENYANYTQVHDNDLSLFNHALEPGAWAGWFWNNSVHNSDWGIYLNENGSFSVVKYTDFNVIWNVKYFSNSIANFNIPAGGTSATNEYTTLLDVAGTPTPTSIQVTFTNQASRTTSVIHYWWGYTVDNLLNVSYVVDAKGPFMPAVTMYSIATGSVNQRVYCRWFGSSTTVWVSHFDTHNITFSPTYSGAATVYCQNLGPWNFFLQKRNWLTQQSLETDRDGGLYAALSGPFSTVYALIYNGHDVCNGNPSC